ncbi:hypothetical protein MTR_8g032820 [Medicago truncatula]|uniref:Uncharacterized protein n=1 Tax=Medicago truncatula TaxID=3880 RepID=A0A072TZL6_MEDTR|nr:hypothetical protein MTR_8g032820 [Medicago truncatula]
MKRFYKPISESEQSSTSNPNPQTLDECESIQLGPPLKKRWLELDLGRLPSDPRLRPRLLDYHPSDREKIRRYYFQKGPCQPREINFPLTKFGDSSNHILKNIEVVSLFSSMIDVLDMIEEDGTSSEQRGDANLFLKCMQSFEFIFILHLMKKVLSITHELSQALQRSDQDIVNAMKLVKMSKQKLQTIRDSGWDSLFYEVSFFCEHHEVVIPNMDDTYQTFKKSKRNSEKVSNLHYFQVQFFYQVIDRQLQELNNHFSEVNTELLLCVACLNPRDSFSAFDKKNLIRLAEFYPSEFSPVQLLELDSQLENYIVDVCSEDAFYELEGIGDLSIKMVETRRHIVYPLGRLQKGSQDQALLPQCANDKNQSIVEKNCKF